MNKIIKYLISLVYKAESKDSEAEMLAKHMANVLLWETKGVESLYVDLAEKTEMLIKRMKELKMPIKVFEGFRSAKKQDRYYEQVPKITNARGLESWHQFGLAVDIIFVKHNWNPPSSDWWQILGKEGKACGLLWGGDWEDFRDRPHFQLAITEKLDMEEIAKYFNA